MKLPYREPLSDLGLFVATVAVASWQDWSATDLVWSLWIASLVVGYAFIVVTLFVGPEDERGGGAILARWAMGLPLLAFFTVHFGGFHFGHSIFLNGFFPLVPESGGWTLAWWGGLTATAVERYWPFLLATAYSRRADFARSLRTDPDLGATLRQPYRNVIRMHILIFVFAGLEAAGLSGFALYPVLFFYFFPLGALKEILGRTGEGAGG